MRSWKSIGSYSYTQVLGYGSLELIFKVKLKLESGNQSIQYACQATILKLTSLKINRLLPIYISIVPLKFGVDFHSQTKVKESGNQNIQYACPAAILKVTSLKINRPLPMTTIYMYMKFEIEIPKQTWLRSGNHAAYGVQKPKEPIWPPGSHFENDLAENQ